MKNFNNNFYNVSVNTDKLYITVSFDSKYAHDDICITFKDITELESVYKDLKDYFEQHNRFLFGEINDYAEHIFIHGKQNLENEKIKKIESLSKEEILDYILNGKTYLSYDSDKNYINAEECNFGYPMNTPKIIFYNTQGEGKVIEQGSYLLNATQYTTLYETNKLFDFYKDSIKSYFVDNLKLKFFYRLTISNISLTPNIRANKIRFEGSK